METRNKGQSVLEYVIVLAAIIAVVITFASGLLKTSVKNSLDHIASEMERKVTSVSIP